MNIAKLTDREVIDLIQSDSPLARARALFSAHSGKIEQAYSQRKPLSSIEFRRMELQAAQEIMALFVAIS